MGTMSEVVVSRPPPFDTKAPSQTPSLQERLGVVTGPSSSSKIEKNKPTGDAAKVRLISFSRFVFKK